MAAAPTSNVERMRAFIAQVQEGGRLELFDDFVHPDFRDHPAKAGLPSDRNSVREILEALHNALTDIKVEVLHCMELEGVVATNKILSGVLIREWLGMVPNGKPIEIRIMDFIRFHDGRMIEHWANISPLER